MTLLTHVSVNGYQMTWTTSVNGREWELDICSIQCSTLSLSKTEKREELPELLPIVMRRTDDTHGQQCGASQGR